MNKLLNYIDGEHSAPESGQFQDGFNPATGLAFYQVPDSGENDVNRAIKAANNAFPAWSKVPATERADILDRLATLIEDNSEHLAKCESEDNGKPYELAKRIDIPRSAKNFRYFARCGSQFASESHRMGSTAINYTLRKPLGVVTCISPWNLPLYLLTWKIAPALAAGNTVVAKPSQVTPLTAYELTKLCQQAGMPKGVLNIVFGKGSQTGAALCKSPDVAAISFTGSTSIGVEIAQQAAVSFKKFSLELGGKNAALIFDDCNFEQAVEESVRSSFTNQGQICLCTSRLLIESSIYEKFKKAFIEKVRALKVGDPAKAESNLGALVSQEHMEKILSCIDLAHEEGGKLLVGGKRIHLKGRCEKGYFVTPTVFENLGPQTRTNQEEIFGPVVTLMPFDSKEEAIRIANSTEYGLASVVWTQDISKALTTADVLESGIVWINTWLLRDLRTPFGGMKKSGYGREGGLEAMRFFTEPKNVCVKL